MEGFCRGCLIKYDEPMELLQYTEKNRRLFVYSTGLQVKRNDTFTFQLCKDCFLNMKQACKFKKNCRTSEKRFRNYIALKDLGDPVDFCTFLKNSDDTLTFRLPMASGNSTPAAQKCRDDDNESTCTSIRNFMTDILQGEEMPDTEARIIKEVIEEEADVLDDSLDSNWLQDDMSIDTDFRLDFSFSQYSTPRSVINDHCYTPKQKDDQITFDTINTEKQTKILNDFTNAFKADENIEEISIFVGDVSNIEKTESLKDLKELSTFGVDEIDGMETSEIDTLKNKQNLKELIRDLSIDEIEDMDTSDSKTVETDQNFQELFGFGIEDINSIHKTKINTLESKEIGSIGNTKSIAVKSNKSLKEFISNLDVKERGDSENKDGKTNQVLKVLMSNFGKDATDAFGKPDSNDPKSNQNHKELRDFILDSFSGLEKVESKTSAHAKSLKELCDFSLESFEDTAKTGSSTFKNNQNVQELCELSLNNFDDIAKSGNNTLKNDRDMKEVCDSSIDGIEKLGSDLDLPSLSDVLEKDRIDTPDFELPKGVIGAIQSNDDVSNSSINIESLLKDKLEKARIYTPDFDIPKSVFGSIQSNNDASNSSLNIEALLKCKPEKARIDTPDFDMPKDVIGSIQSNNDTSNSSINIEALLKYKLEKARIDTPDFEIPKGVIGSIHSNNDASNSSINIEALLKYKPCSIDKKIEEALKNTDNKQYSLEDILISPPVFPAVSAASTPTITNILFGENLDTSTNAKIEQCLESYQGVQGDIEIFEEFFQNDTKEFYLDDIKRENVVFKAGDCKKPFATNDIEVANKENELENIEMEISIDDKDLAGNNYDTAVKKSKTEPMICIAHDDDTDKFDIETLYCKLCEIRYDTGKAFSIHFAKAHRIKIVKPRIRNKNKQVRTKNKMEATINIFDTPAAEKFDLENSYCKLCNIKYNSSRALCIHFAKTHNIKIVKPKNVKINRNLELLCNVCGKKSRDMTNYTRHVKNCGKKDMVFKCDRCQEEFTSQTHLDKHMACHTQMKRLRTGKEYVCTICGAILHMKYNFDLHMRRHMKDYSVSCEYCDKGFYRQADLKVHLRNHTGETPYSCKFCPKVYSRRDVLLRHVLVHLDERLFECDYCGLKCIKKYDLLKHIKNESCRKVKKPKKKKRKIDKKEIPEKQEEKIEVGKEDKTRVTKKVKIEVRNKEKIEDKKEKKVRKEEIMVEVVKDVTVIYAKGSDATLMKQLPFLETERSN